MNLSPGYLWASIVCAVAVAFLLILTIIDRRTAPPNVPFVPYEPDDDEDYAREDRLELYMLMAISRGHTAISNYQDTKDEWELINGVLDMRIRLVKGLDMEADELAERLEENEGAQQ